jgi:TetR/AcrR family transcriptional repressor of mexJK operon
MTRTEEPSTKKGALGVCTEGMSIPPFLEGTDKRTLVLRAAFILFLQHGYSGTSMDAVTAEAGVSKATVYSHFKSKDILFASLMREGSESVFAQFPPLARGKGSPEDDLNAFFGPILQLIVAKRGYAWHRLVIAEGVRHPENSKLFYSSVIEKIVALIQGYLNGLVFEGAIPNIDTKLAAEALLSLTIIRPIHTILLVGPEGIDRCGSVKFNIHLFLKGLGAKV